MNSSDTNMLEASLARDILGTLGEESALLRDMLDFSERKRLAIIGDDTAQLEKINEAEEALTFEIIQLELKRESLLEAASGISGRDKKELTLARIAVMTDDTALARSVHKLRRELSEILRLQKKLNSTNKQLLKRKKQYADFMLSALLQREPVAETYERDRTVRGACTSAGLFDFCV